MISLAAHSAVRHPSSASGSSASLPRAPARAFARVRPRLRTRIVRFLRHRLFARRRARPLRPQVHAHVFARIVSYLPYHTRLAMRLVCEAMRQVVDASYEAAELRIEAYAGTAVLRYVEPETGRPRRLPFSFAGGTAYWARGAALETITMARARRVRLTGDRDDPAPPSPRVNELLKHLGVGAELAVTDLPHTRGAPLKIPRIAHFMVGEYHMLGDETSKLHVDQHSAFKLSISVRTTLIGEHPLTESYMQARGRATRLLNSSVLVLAVWIAGERGVRPKAEDAVQALRLVFANLHRSQMHDDLCVMVDTEWRRFGGSFSNSQFVLLIADLFHVTVDRVRLNMNEVWGLNERRYGSVGGS